MKTAKNTILSGIRLIVLLALFIPGDLKMAYSQISRVREVSGIVKDSIEDAVIGSTVVIKTQQDSLRTVTNSQGVFIFKGLSSGQFTLSVRSIGYLPFNKRYFYKDETSQIILDPVILRNSSTLLAEIKINGSTSIVYKQDTTEYRAFGYKVKANAYVEDLIKKMEGFNVSANGSVTHQGIPVQSAKLNGQTYAGGSIANAIKTLPAEIVEKIQMIDDYDEQAERTGIKDKEPERILNIVTRSDKSVGNRLVTDASGGNNERYDGKINFTRLNLNQQIVATTNVNRSMSGITEGGTGFSLVGSPGSSGAGGTRNSFKSSIGYTDRLNKKIKIAGNYTVESLKTNQVNNSLTEEYNQKFGRVYLTDNGVSTHSNVLHSLTGELKYTIDSANFLSVNPSFSYTHSDEFNTAAIVQSGGIRQDANKENSTSGKIPSLGITSLYAHNFEKAGRVFSVSMALRGMNNERYRNTTNHYTFYDALSGNFIADSVAALLTDFANSTMNGQISATYSEPLNLTSKIEFNAQLNKREYRNDQLVDQIINDVPIRSELLSRIYHYSFLEQRYSVNYRYLKGKYNLSLGLTALPFVLKGRSESLNTNTRRTTFNVIPLFRAQYLWSRLKTLNINYYGTPREPGFEQIQDVADVSDPQNVVVGNPLLKAEFRHSINTIFNVYQANSKLNVSLNGRINFINNKVVRNIIEIDQSRGTKMIYFENRSGEFSTSGYYDISKQFNSINYKIKIRGEANFSKSPSLINGNSNIARTLSFTQNLGIELIPVKWLEFNPGARYAYQHADFNLGTDDRKMEVYGFTASGRVDISSSLFCTFNGSKNYLSGVVPSAGKNPLLINCSMSKDFLNKKGTFKVEIFDLLDQNNFVLRRIGTNSITDYRSDISSRDLMLGLILRLQKWTAAPKRDGKEIKRNGDGSFMD